MKDYIGSFAELISLIITIVYYKDIKNSYMKWFLPFLLFIFLGELFAKYLYSVLNRSTISMQYFIGISESIFYGFIFYKLYDRLIFKKLIIFLVLINTLIFSLGFFFFTDEFSYFFPSIILCGFFLAVIALGYIYTKYVDDDEIILLNESGFWLAMGVSMFFSGTSIVFTLHDVIIKNNLTFFGVKLYNFVPRVLSVILYASISIAIILCKKKTKALS